MVTFQRARRESIGLLIGLAGPSGSGKTYSAMELATGLSGGEPFAVIDTEAGRAKHYAHRFTFDHCDISPPFRPDTYLEAIEAADKAGYPVIVVDSMSHEHAGDGGLLDWHEEELERMAGNDWAKRERVKFAAWIKPKGAHKRMVSKLLQIRAHLILCFRAEQKTELGKDPNGKTIVVPKTTLSGFSDWIPIAEKNMLYELTVSILMMPDKPGYPRPVKIEEGLREFIDGGYARTGDTRLDRTIGVHLAAWAQGIESGAGVSGGERAKAETHEAASPPAPDCPECSVAGRDQCSVHAGSEDRSRLVTNAEWKRLAAETQRRASQIGCEGREIQTRILAMLEVERPSELTYGQLCDALPMIRNFKLEDLGAQ